MSSVPSFVLFYDVDELCLSCVRLMSSVSSSVWLYEVDEFCLFVCVV